MRFMVKNILTSEADTGRVDDFGYETGEVKKVAEAVHIRSWALPGIFLILLLGALKLAAEFFVPVAVALLLKFLLASLVRGLSRLHVPEALSAAVVVIAFVVGVAFG